MPICLQIVYGCFSANLAELCSCDKEVSSAKWKAFTVWSFSEKVCQLLIQQIKQYTTYHLKQVLVTVSRGDPQKKEAPSNQLIIEHWLSARFLLGISENKKMHIL